MYKKDLIELFKFKNIYNEYSIHNIIKNKNIIVYGAGEGWIAFKNIIVDKYNIKPTYVLDKSFMKPLILNETIFGNLDNCVITKKEKDNSVVVITVGNKELYESIHQELDNSGFKNIIKSSDIFEFNLHHTTTEFVSNEKEFYLNNKENILKCYDLLSDNISKEIFYSIMRVYTTHKPEFINKNHESEQYFPSDIKLNKEYSRFINCGSFTGDTIVRLVNHIGKIDSLVCIEPDYSNFLALTNYIKNNSDSIANNIVCLPCAVFNEENKITFSSDKSLCSSIFDKGDEIIQSISLDNCFPNFAPTFINMDIEGAELEALKGAKNLIQKYKPDLAISTYHFPNHLWELLLYIDSLGVNYNYYLRNYSGFTYETILYATTKDN